MWHCVKLSLMWVVSGAIGYFLLGWGGSIICVILSTMIIEMMALSKGLSDAHEKLHQLKLTSNAVLHTVQHLERRSTSYDSQIGIILEDIGMLIEKTERLEKHIDG